MNEKELQLVTFEQAKRLKALGFDWESDKLYAGDTPVRAGSEDFPIIESSPYSNWNDEGYDRNDGVEKEWFSAPSVALALKWVRDVKSIGCGIMPRRLVDRVRCCRWYSIGGFITANSDPKTFETAESELLDELLTILEKEEQQ